MKTIVIAAGLLIAAGACKRNEPTPENDPRIDSARPAADNERAAADNTERNERDRNPSALTPTDQAENESDRTITQQVRKNVVGNDALSMTAENVKIITANGVVTLRGPVKTAAEKAEIARIAQGTAGVTRVDNQLEVAAEQPR